MPMIAAVPAISTLSLETEPRRPPPPLWPESIAPLSDIVHPFPGRDRVPNPWLFILPALEYGMQAGIGWRRRIPTTEAHARIGKMLNSSERTLHSRPGRAR